jgi:hypothetical protein
MCVVAGLVPFAIRTIKPAAPVAVEQSPSPELAKSGA